MKKKVDDGDNMTLEHRDTSCQKLMIVCAYATIHMFFSTLFIKD